MSPSVSVIIPAYNAESWIRRAVDSVLAQCHAPREIIVVDDGSTDRTAEILNQYECRIRVIRQSNRGLSAARNVGINAACGDIIAFLDADDYWQSRKLAAQTELMRERPEIGFCSTAALLVDDEDREVGTWKCPECDGAVLTSIFERHATIAGSGSAVAVRRKILEQAGQFDETLSALEDIDMWMRLAVITNYACIPERLTVIRKGQESMSKNIDLMRQAAICVIHKNRHLLPKELQGRFWNNCYAGMLADYAKWQIRSGRKAGAIIDILHGLLRSPVSRGRLFIGLLLLLINGKVPS